MTASKIVAVAGVVALAAWATPSVAQQQQPGGQSPSGSPAAQGQSQPASPTSSAQSQGKSGQQSIDSKSIVGSKVRSSDGKDLGKVERVMIDPTSGKVDSITISSGGMLGGGKTVSVPWDSAKIARDPQRSDEIVVVVEQQMLDTAPAAASPKTNDGNQQNRDRNQKKQ